MTTSRETTAAKNEVEALLHRLQQAHIDKDADAIAAAYAAGAVIYEMAPPLGRRGMNRDAVANWLATWDGPITIEAHDVGIVVAGDIAFATALNRMRSSQGGERQDIWFRTTTCFRKRSGRWQIVHDHSSVPFYMDGSYRAATDLKP